MDCLRGDPVCPICNGTLAEKDDVVKIQKKGADGIIAASLRRGDSIAVTVGSQVHSKCRKKYTNSIDIDLFLNKKQESAPPPRKRSLRTAEGPFDSRTDCLFCGTNVHDSEKQYSKVTTDVFTKSILECCDKRNDEWGIKVKGRIEYYGGDLHAAACVYHQDCSCHFRCGRKLPMQHQSGPKPKLTKSGRPKDEDQQGAFLKMCSYLEANDDEQLTISDLTSTMMEFSELDIQPYSKRYLKAQLQKEYGNSIYISESDGVHDIVTMREKTSDILRSYYNNRKKEGDEESQKKEILEAAARILKSDIKTSVPPVGDFYATPDMMDVESATAYIPETLQTFLNSLFVGDSVHQKIASIGHAIIQAVRPRVVLAPLQLGLAAQVHHL